MIKVIARVLTDVLAVLGGLTAVAALIDPLLSPSHGLVRLKILLVLLILGAGVAVCRHLVHRAWQAGLLAFSLGTAAAVALFMPHRNLGLWSWTPDPAQLNSSSHRAEDAPQEAYKAGVTHYIRREFDRALAAFSHAQRDHRVRPYALNRKANTLRVMKRYEEAVEAYDASIRASGVIHLATDRHALLTNSYHDKGWCLRRLAELRPEKSTAWNEIQSEAQKAFLTAAEFNPAFAKSWFMAGQVCLDRGEWEQAVYYNTKAFSLDTEYYRPAYNLAWIYATRREEQEAFLWLERALQIDASQAYNARASDVFTQLADQARFNQLIDTALRSLAVPSRPVPTATP